MNGRSHKRDSSSLPATTANMLCNVLWKGILDSFTNQNNLLSRDKAAVGCLPNHGVCKQLYVHFANQSDRVGRSRMFTWYVWKIVLFATYMYFSKCMMFLWPYILQNKISNLFLKCVLCIGQISFSMFFFFHCLFVMYRLVIILAGYVCAKCKVWTVSQSSTIHTFLMFQVPLRQRLASLF
jgi:hypothetical protein